MVSAKPGAMYKYICIKKSVAFERTVWKLYLQHQLVSGAYNMQIWEAETLHMSQLAGGWDFLMLSGWRCASKKKKAYFITNNHAVVWRLCAAAGAGGAALLGWAETSPGTAGSTKAVAEVGAHWIARSRETASTAY